MEVDTTWICSLLESQPVACDHSSHCCWVRLAARHHCQVQVVQADQQHGTDIHVGCALHHIPIDTYLQAEVVCSDSDGVIVRTRSE